MVLRGDEAQVEPHFSPFVDSADWKVPGLCLPASAFLHRFLHYFDISLNHLTSNAVLHLSVFVHLCEAFIGIVPSISLFCLFFYLKSLPRNDSTSPLGGSGIQFRQGKKALFFDYDLIDFA
jgi:hypothetical protein